MAYFFSKEMWPSIGVHFFIMLRNALLQLVQPLNINISWVYHWVPVNGFNKVACSLPVCVAIPPDNKAFWRCTSWLKGHLGISPRWSDFTRAGIVEQVPIRFWFEMDTTAICYTLMELLFHLRASLSWATLITLYLVWSLHEKSSQTASVI